MSRCAPAKVRSLVDVAKILFVLSLLLAFGMRRGLAEVQTRLPWLGMALFSFIAITGAFLLITALLYRKKPEPDSEISNKNDDSAGPDSGH